MNAITTFKTELIQAQQNALKTQSQTPAPIIHKNIPSNASIYAN
jgi:hypothetical protein